MYGCVHVHACACVHLHAVAPYTQTHGFMEVLSVGLNQENAQKS